MSDAVYTYSNKQAVEDGIFADVTQASVKDMRWLVTASVHGEFSLAAIAEMYNDFVTAIRNSPQGWESHQPYSTKMNGKELWCFLESDSEYGRVFKVIFPSEY